MSVAHSVRTEVSQKRDIWKDKEENRRNHPKIVRTKRCRNYRNRSMQRPYNKHKTKGYRYLANLVRNETGWIFSDNLAHKCCKLEGIRSKTNRERKTVGKENIKFPNTVKGNWNVTKPLEIVVSDMTCIMHKGVRWEWTYLLDVFNNEIIASSVTNKGGSSLPYYHCLEYLIEKKKEQTYPVTFHTDQGSVYSSAGFYQTHKDYTNIKRSMSRAGTPTDNPIIESLNGWIKEEMRTDFSLNAAEGIPSFIENYVHYFNNERLSYKLNYKPLFNTKLNKGLHNWWFLLSTFT